MSMLPTWTREEADKLCAMLEAMFGPVANYTFKSKTTSWKGEICPGGEHGIDVCFDATWEAADKSNIRVRIEYFLSNTLTYTVERLYAAVERHYIVSATEHLPGTHDPDMFKYVKDKLPTTLQGWADAIIAAVVQVSLAYDVKVTEHNRLVQQAQQQEDQRCLNGRHPTTRSAPSSGPAKR